MSDDEVRIELWRDVLRHRDDDGPREAFADYLVSVGETKRAGFIHDSLWLHRSEKRGPATRTENRRRRTVSGRMLGCLEEAASAEWTGSRLKVKNALFPTSYALSFRDELDEIRAGRLPMPLDESALPRVHADYLSSDCGDKSHVVYVRGFIEELHICQFEWAMRREGVYAPPHVLEQDRFSDKPDFIQIHPTGHLLHCQPLRKVTLLGNHGRVSERFIAHRWPGLEVIQQEYNDVHS